MILGRKGGDYFHQQLWLSGELIIPLIEVLGPEILIEGQEPESCFLDLGCSEQVASNEEIEESFLVEIGHHCHFSFGFQRWKIVLFTDVKKFHGIFRENLRIERSL